MRTKMTCPECDSDDISKDWQHVDSLGVVCVCVACDATWIADRGGNIEYKTVCAGEGRRELQRQIDAADFHKQFNDPDGFGL